MTEKFQNIIRWAGSSKAIRISLHVLFWLIVGSFYYFIFTWNSEFPRVSLIFSLGLLPVALMETYLFNYVLIPNYLSYKKYGKFFLYSLFALLVSTWLSFLIVFYALLRILNTLAILEPAVLHPELQVISLNFIVFLGISIKQVKRAFYIQQEKNDLEKTKLITELKLKEAELKLLKAQIHPHFLFNTLNNLYGLTLEKSEEAPRMVLQLSEILDYILYRCEARVVPLSEELDHLRNYISIEKVRYSEKLDLKISFPEKTSDFKIAPLLLLPIVENAFKHGVSHFPGIAFVTITCKIEDQNLHFKIENPKNPLAQNGVNEKAGIGLSNVQKRLEMIYPNKHMLQIFETDTTFSLLLTLELEE